MGLAVDAGRAGICHRLVVVASARIRLKPSTAPRLGGAGEMPAWPVPAARRSVLWTAPPSFLGRGARVAAWRSKQCTTSSLGNSQAEGRVLHRCAILGKVSRSLPSNPVVTGVWNV